MIGGSCRAKRADNGEWIIGEMENGGHYISRYTKHIRQSLESEETGRVISRYDSMTTKVDQDTICGYSGRLDKNGDKIFENDVVSYIIPYTDQQKTGVVKSTFYFDEVNENWYTAFYLSVGEEHILFKDIETDEILIIGNIFDNPELSADEEDRFWNIYQEGYIDQGSSGAAYYIGCARGKTFFDACENFIKEKKYGESWYNLKNEKCYGYWGCRWFPTLKKAQESYG